MEPVHFPKNVSAGGECFEVGVVARVRGRKRESREWVIKRGQNLRSLVVRRQKTKEVHNVDAGMTALVCEV